MDSDSLGPIEDTEDWTSAVMGRVQSSDSVVPEHTLASFEKLLRGQARDRKLTPAVLKKVATQLLKEKGTCQPKPEEKQ